MAIIGKKKMKRAVKFYQSINKFNQEKQWCEITGKAPRMKNRKHQCKGNRKVVFSRQKKQEEKFGFEEK